METKKSRFTNLFQEDWVNSKLIKWLELGLILLIVFVVSMLTLSASNPQLYPPGRDGGFFLYVGKSIQSGARLYADIWDSKGPMIFWINALGVGSDYSRGGLFVIQVFFQTTALFIAYSILKEKYGFLPAICTILIGSHFFNRVIGSGNYTEEYSLLFTWISIAAFSHMITNYKKTFWPFFLMGVTIVLNFLLRANNIGTQAIVILAALIYVFNQRKETNFWLAMVYLLVGALTIAIPTSIYFIINGTFTAMIDASILYNFIYSTERGSSFSNSIAPAFTAFNKWFYVFGIAWLLAVKDFISGLKKKEFRPFVFLTVFALPVETIMSSISGRGYGHYFICWIPALMLLVAFLFSIVQTEVIRVDFREKCETVGTPLILFLILLFIVGNSFTSVTTTTRFLAASAIRPNVKREFQEPFARVFQSLTDETDKVLVFGGQAGINIMAQRDSIKGALFYPAINNSRIGTVVQTNYFENLQEEPPLLIIDGHLFLSQQIPAIDPIARQNQRFVVSFSNNLDLVLDWINANYERYDEANGYVIYRLRSDSQ